MDINVKVDRIKVWKQTQEIVEKQMDNYKHIPSVKYNLDLVRTNIKKNLNKTDIFVIDEDCINASKTLLNNQYNPLLLNMSDDIYAGGCVGNGSGAQEENLFRRSTYYKTLLQTFYPLNGTDLIYSPKVLFFREDEKSNYNISKNIFECACIACPALKYPSRNKSGHLEDESDIKLMEDKVRTILFTALKHDHDSLVLSAHGCGAWGCPPEDIAQIYKRVINEFNDCFKLILFSILNDHYSSGKNFQIFKDIIEN
jgi:uncharacterized protein (TIGR02452 family)